MPIFRRDRNVTGTSESKQRRSRRKDKDKDKDREASDGDLVTDPTEPEAPLPEPVKPLPDEVLVGDPVNVAGLGVALFSVGYMIGKDIGERMNKSNQASSVADCTLHCHVMVNVGEVTVSDKADPPKTPEVSTPPTSDDKADSPDVTVTIGTPEIISTTPEEKDKGKAPKITSPGDTAVPPPDAAEEAFQSILEDQKSMSFADAEAADAYLQQRMDEVGIEAKVTADGFKVVEKVVDPANVTAQLKAQGIADKAVIQQAVSETNAALQQLETFVGNARADLATVKAATAPSSTDPQLGSLFRSVVPTWDRFVPSDFEFTDGSEPPPLGTGSRSRRGSRRRRRRNEGSVVPDELTPIGYMEMTYQSALGVKVQANVGTEISITTGLLGLDPGIHFPPFVSIFDESPPSPRRRA